MSILGDIKKTREYCVEIEFRVEATNEEEAFKKIADAIGRGYISKFWFTGIRTYECKKLL